MTISPIEILCWSAIVLAFWGFVILFILKHLKKYMPRKARRPQPKQELVQKAKKEIPEEETFEWLANQINMVGVPTAFAPDYWCTVTAMDNGEGFYYIYITPSSVNPRDAEQSLSLSVALKMGFTCSNELVNSVLQSFTGDPDQEIHDQY